MQTRRSARHLKPLSENMRSEKRKASPIPVVEIRKIQKKTFQDREIDLYCWICHKMGQTLICNSCPRVYHAECLNNSMSFNDRGSCAECQSQSVNKGNEPTTIGRLRLKELLKFAFQEALLLNAKGKKLINKSQEPENVFPIYFKSWPEGITESICQIIDLDILIDKMNDDINPYLTTAKFFSDVKWIYHNCYILYGVDSEITTAAQKLERNFRKEMLDIEACPQCYYNKHSVDFVDADFFPLVCDKPHDIVWAKLRGSPYWPAKCLKIFGGQADIRFFGTHEKSIVPISKCYFMSEESPNAKEIKQRKYIDACNELSAYIQEYENKVGDFQYYPPKTPLDKSKQQKLNSQKDNSQNNLDDDPDIIDLTVTESEETSFQESPTNEIIEPDSSATAASELIQFLERSLQEQLPASSASMDFSNVEENPLHTFEAPMQPSTSSLDAFSVKNSFAHKDILGTSTSAEQLSQCSSLFANSVAPDLPPVITSRASDAGSSNDNSVGDPPDLLQCITDMLANSTSASEKEAGPSNPVNRPVRDEVEDDLIIIKEKVAPPTAVNAVMNNPHLVHALSELVQSNHPHLQEFYKKCMEFGLKSFLRLWLATVLKWQDVNAVMLFASLYKAISTTNTTLKKDYEDLRNINKLLTQENNSLKQEVQNMKGQLTIHEEKKTLQERLTNTKRVIGMLLSKFRPEWESYDHNELNENVLLAKKVKQYQDVLAEKDSKIKELENELQLLTGGEIQVVSDDLSSMLMNGDVDL